MNKERILYLDVVRIVACAMIIIMHAPIPNTGISSTILVTDTVLTTPGVGLFIMVSGALLLPVKLPTGVFLKKRLSKIVFPVIFWTFFYMGIKLLSGVIVLSDILQPILSIPFSAQFNGILWFVYMLIGLYFLAPIISPWIEKASRREIEFYLILWAITLCYPFIKGIVSVNDSATGIQNATGILYYFSGYSGYFLLGYYLKRFAPQIPLALSFALVVFPLIVGAYLKLLVIEVDFCDLFWYLSVLVAGATLGWFVIIKRLTPSVFSANIVKSLALISNCCFGIYLSHAFVMRTILWNWVLIQNLEGVIQIAVTSVLTLIGSFIVTWLISKLPFGNYIVGYRNRG